LGEKYIGELPYLAAGFVPHRICGCFGPVALTELGQRVSDVVFHRLSGDAEPGHRSRRWTSRHRPAGAPPPPAWSVCRTPSGRSGMVRPGTGAMLRRRQRAGPPGVSRSPPMPPSPPRWRPRVPVRPGSGHLQAALCEHHRRLRLGESLQSIMQARPGVLVSTGDTHPPPRERCRCSKIRALLRFRDAAQAVSRSLGFVEAAVLDAHLDKLRDEWADQGRCANGQSVVTQTLRGAFE
jgi:hypothetical protein